MSHEINISKEQSELEEALIKSIGDALQKLKEKLSRQSKKLKNLILVEGRYISFRTDQLRGLLSISDKTLIKNEIRNDLLELIYSLEFGDFVSENEADEDHSDLPEETSQIETGGKELFRKIRIIACGYGYWARNRTVSPFIFENPDLIEIKAITNLIGGEKEFNEIKKELEELNFKRSLPTKVLKNNVSPIPNYLKKDFHSCYVGNNEYFFLKGEYLESNKRALLQFFYEERPELLPPKIIAPRYYSEFEEAYANHKDIIEAVVINTPNNLHIELVDSALSMGLHVYAERPINPYNEKLGALLWSANSKKKLLYSGVQRRLEDPFRYIYNVVKNKFYFKQLKSVKIFLASGRKLKGWRLDKKRAGGGIVTDEGYHLLDAAAWVMGASETAITKFEYRKITGGVTFRYEPVSWLKEVPDGIETSAFGFLHLPNNVDLKFDLSYNAPENSVFEFFEIKDVEGNMVRLLRDQSKRSPQPAVITHQLSSGELVISHVPLDEAGNSSISNSFSIKMDKISFSGKANTSGPLSQFLINILSDKSYVSQNQDFKGIECDANLLVNTDELVKAIYHIEKKSSNLNIT